MTKLTNKEWDKRKIHNKLFYPNTLSGLDGETETPESYFKWIKSCKYTEDQKSKIVKKILTDYDISDKIIYNKIRKCLPNGFNQRYSIEDNEYEALLEAFKL